MSSKFSTFICQNCGSETSQYFGRCVNCNEWNTIVEERQHRRSKTTNINKSKKSKLFNEIEIEKISRFTSGFKEFDRVLGGGVVPGSIVLLGGEPGIGKSTIVLLPIPGSPPSNTIDPGTIPPPRTLSNSLKPLVNLEIFSISIS